MRLAYIRPEMAWRQPGCAYAGNRATARVRYRVSSSWYPPVSRSDAVRLRSFVDIGPAPTSDQLVERGAYTFRLGRRHRAQTVEQRTVVARDVVCGRGFG